MIFERLTDRAREVLVNGRLAAQQCRHRSVEAPHLLVGILRTRDTKGCEALNGVGLRYLDVLSVVQGMYPPAAQEPCAPPVLTTDAKRLLDGAMQEAAGQEHRSVETLHLALACARPDAPSSIKPLVAGREQAIRDAVLNAQERPRRLEAEVAARRRPAPPQRSALSRMDALERANAVRTQRAKLKKDLKAGRVAIDELLRDPSECLQTARVIDILLAVAKCGRVKVTRLLAECRISPSKTIGGLSRRQRTELIALL